MIAGLARLRAFPPWLGVWIAVPVVAGAWWMGHPNDLQRWYAAGSVVAVLGVQRREIAKKGAALRWSKPE
jgi:hypothetical protein